MSSITPFYPAIDLSYSSKNNPPATAVKSGAGFDSVAAGVMSGIANIANSFINAQQVRNAAKYNAGMSELQGRMTRLSADVEIKNIRKKAQSLFSYQRAAYAKAGLKMGGSPIQVMMDSLKEAELDAIYADINASYNIGTMGNQANLEKKMTVSSANENVFQNSLKSILDIGIKTYTRR